MASDDQTRKQADEDAHEDLELAEGDAEGITGGGKAKQQQKVEYLKVTMSEVLISGVGPE
jgi:hypothetical protein